MRFKEFIYEGTVMTPVEFIDGYIIWQKILQSNNIRLGARTSMLLFQKAMGISNEDIISNKVKIKLRDPYTPEEIEKANVDIIKDIDLSPLQKYVQNKPRQPQTDQPQTDQPQQNNHQKNDALSQLDIKNLRKFALTIPIKDLNDLIRNIKFKLSKMK